MEALPVYTVSGPKQVFDVILAALNELPHKIARGPYDAVLRQLQEQEAASAATGKESAGQTPE